MCLSPLKILNPTSNIAKYGGQLLSLNVPCGKCAECVTAKRNEWYLRSYYEVQNTFANCGYVYFDTLTYRDEDIPRLSHVLDVRKYGLADFTCFSHVHFKLFLKRLRRRLQYHYHCNDFRYFLTSEYGEREGYTHRPHYHIMFFVYAPVPPLEFSKLVSECWSYGRTDGLPYKTLKYVSSHIYGHDVGFGLNKDFAVLSSVCMYVSKYITKSNKFRAKLLKRMDAVAIAVDDEELVKKLFRDLDMFHRQSQGFGLSYLTQLTREQVALLDNDKMSIKDKNDFIKTYPLPMYYKRHLYYKNKKRSDGRRYWELTNAGFEHWKHSRLNKVDDKVLKYMDIVLNASEVDRDMFYYYLGKRDISELVVYELFYKGRLRYKDSVSYYLDGSPISSLTDFEANLFDWLKALKVSSKSNSLSFGKCFLVDEDKRNIYLIKHDYDRLLFDDDKRIYRELPLERFVYLYTFNENSCVEFKDFDKLLSLLQFIVAKSKQQEQTTFDFLEDYREKMKNINI